MQILTAAHPTTLRAMLLALALLLVLAPFARAEPARDTASDRLDVIELSSRYAWGVDAVDRDALARVFAPDAVADYVAVGENAMTFNEHLVGFDNIFAWLHKNLGHRKGTAGLPMHFVTNHIVELHGDSADLRYYMHNRSMAAGGVYFVKAVRTPQGWRIASLRLEEQTWNPDHYKKDPKSSQYLKNK